MLAAGNSPGGFPLVDRLPGDSNLLGKLLHGETEIQPVKFNKISDAILFDLLIRKQITTDNLSRLSEKPKPDFTIGIIIFDIIT